MALTKAEIRDRVATDYLGILQLNQSLQDQDKTRIEQGYDEVYEYLKTKGLATWASTASVPNDLAPYMIIMVAENCRTTYSLSKEKEVRIIGKFVNAENKLRELVSLDQPLGEDPKNY